MNKITVIYDPDEGDCVPDALALNYAQKVAENSKIEKQTTRVGSEIIIQAFRVLVKRGDICLHQIDFFYGDVLISCGVNNTLSSWPTGFCDYSDNLISEILGWGEDE